MNVVWLADYDMSDHPGGAQKTNDVMIKAGERRGHNITIMKAKNFDRETIANSDIVITNNIRTFRESDLLFALEHENIRYEHDYAIADHNILQGKPYTMSRRNIFLSPLHQKEVEKKSGWSIDNAYHVQSPVDPEIFKVTRGKRKPHSVLFAHQLCQEKGIVEFEGYIKDQVGKEFTVCGWGDGADLVRDYDNVTYLGTVDHKKLVKLYNAHQLFYARPLWKEPFGRSVVEAYLCGCDLLVNDNIGALSYDWDWNDYGSIKKHMTDAPKLFWQIIEND